MKPSYSCLLLLFIVTTWSISYIGTATAQPPVMDITGREVVRNGGKYHIIPIEGGKIKLADTMHGEKICPFNVVLYPSEGKLGDGFYFTHYTRDAILHTSRILSIDSDINPVSGCEESTIWTIQDAEAKAPSNLITTGGGRTKCFRIVKYPRSISPDKMYRPQTYMLQYCPLFCGGAPKITCFNISIYLDNGVGRLASSGDTPFEFGFYKVQATQDSM